MAGAASARLVQELKEKFAGRERVPGIVRKGSVDGHSRALAASSARRRVIIPAYTCFSVPSAIVKAGLKVVLCDVESETLDFNFEELEGLMNKDVLCVLRPIFLAVRLM